MHLHDMHTQINILKDYLYILLLSMLLLKFLLSHHIAKNKYYYCVLLLVVLAFFICMTKLDTFIRKVVVFMATCIQINQNVGTVISPLLGNASLTHFLFSSNFVSYRLTILACAKYIVPWCKLWNLGRIVKKHIWSLCAKWYFIDTNMHSKIGPIL